MRSDIKSYRDVGYRLHQGPGRLRPCYAGGVDPGVLWCFDVQSKRGNRPGINGRNLRQVVIGVIRQFESSFQAAHDAACNPFWMMLEYTMQLAPAC